MWTQLETFQRLDSRFRGNDKQGGNDEGDAFPWSPYPKLGLALPTAVPSPQDMPDLIRNWGFVGRDVEEHHDEEHLAEGELAVAPPLPRGRE